MSTSFPTVLQLSYFAPLSTVVFKSEGLDSEMDLIDFESAVVLEKRILLMLSLVGKICDDEGDAAECKRMVKASMEGA